MSQTSNRTLVLFLFLAALSLLSGLYAGLLRVDMSIADLLSLSAMIHGPVMINGFLGTLIGLERSAALDKKWAYGAPLFFTIGSISFILGSSIFGKWFMLIGAILFSIIAIYLYIIDKEPYHIIMALGGLSLLIGNLLFLLDYPIGHLVMWWVLFPLLTIFGERLELNRIMRPTPSMVLIFTILNYLLVLSAIVSLFNLGFGWHIFAIVLIFTAIWLVINDIARFTFKNPGWNGYSGTCLLTGYGWLVLGGITLLLFDFKIAGPHYDTFLHVLFVGFVFSMIFAHASVIIPALSGKIIPYHNYFYLPLLLLHLGLIIRLTGNLLPDHGIRTFGSYINVVAILMFLGGVLFQIVKSNLMQRTQ